MIKISELKEMVGHVEKADEACAKEKERDIDIAVMPTTEYRHLVACETLLDVILLSRSDGGYYSDAVIRAAHDIRGRQCPAMAIKPQVPAPAPAAEGGDGE